MFKDKKRERGMTLVEIMVVVTIIGLIAGMTTVYVVGRLGESKIKVASTEIKNIESALELYHVETGAYPTTEEGLRVLVEKAYLKKTPKDPWGTEYVYYCPGIQGHDYEIYSFGADKKEGGAKENSDISSFDDEGEKQK